MVELLLARARVPRKDPIDPTGGWNDPCQLDISKGVLGGS
jgi:hypothetical protein